MQGLFLAIQWLRLHVFNVGEWGAHFPSLVGELRPHIPLGKAKNSFKK